MSLNELYRQMLRMFGGGQFIINGIHGLLNKGYMTRRDNDATYFAVTDAFVGVMQQYA